MSISPSLKTKLPCLLFLLLISLSYSHAFYRKYLLCLQHCQTHQQQLGEEQHCEEGCLRAYKKQAHWLLHDQPVEETIYKFHAERFTMPIQVIQGGFFAVLERFDRRSDLLEGMRNYRLLMSRANPETFVIPAHRNADSLAIVVNGRASVTIIQQDNTETRNVEFGDIFRIPAGSIVHFVNTHSDVHLFHLLEIAVDAPPQVEFFFGPGSGDQESFFNAFSDDILQAAFNLEKDQVRKLFQGRNESAFVRASHEQIQALVESGEQQSSSIRPHNIFKQRPSLSNKYGKMYEFHPQDYPTLQDFDAKITYTNLTKGGMFGPYYNSRSTTIIMDCHGRGYVQMVCPQQGGTSYKRVRAKSNNGDMFIVPAGCPFVMVASEAKNLQVVSFEVRARNNHRVALAGKNNILKQLEKEAKELSFNISSEQVDDILNKQQRSWFFPAPQ